VFRARTLIATVRIRPAKTSPSGNSASPPQRCSTSSANLTARSREMPSTESLNSGWSEVSTSTSGCRHVGMPLATGATKTDALTTSGEERRVEGSAQMSLFDISMSVTAKLSELSFIPIAAVRRGHASLDPDGTGTRFNSSTVVIDPARTVRLDCRRDLRPDLSVTPDAAVTRHNSPTPRQPLAIWVSA
jgi:hypothetical protein